MGKLWRALVVLVAVGAMVAPLMSKADPVETNPFGSLVISSITKPSGVTPGTATLTIQSDRPTTPVYFGFRIMGGEDMEMTSFSLPTNPHTNPCIVSDFAGRNTSGGWQGTPVFGAGQDTPVGTSLNAHMRMIGGYLRKDCGDLIVHVTYRSLPFVAFYGAFFGTSGAPWHNNYGAAPWNVVPAGPGGDAYQNWWNLWGSFDTLGYSNAVTYTG